MAIGAVSDSSDFDSRSKIVTWHVIVTASEPTRIGPFKLAWELSHHPDVDTRTVLARYECVARNEDIGELSSDTSSSPSDSAWGHTLSDECLVLADHLLFSTSRYPLPTRALYLAWG